ncbi:YlxM family DNA-binding protein [Azotosporobacter soli]|uniref:YlxM family DNA-binding protein n=1 Tax=Azotosporobacter soli TaxID=3055040 RepID=UPI0031FEC627
MLERILWLGKLVDAYGSLLTERQQLCLELHYDQDLSLGEIAEQLNVSRQAVHDMLKRSELQLQEYEDKLGLVNRQQRQLALLQQTASLLADLPEALKTDGRIIEAAKRIQKLLELPDEV